MTSPRPRIVLLLEYLVSQALAGNMHVVNALYDYFVNMASPSELARKYGVTKHQVRGYVQRVMEKINNFERSRVLIKNLVPHVMKIKPVVRELRDHTVKCTLCGEIMHREIARDHVARFHSDLVDEYVFAILDIVSRSIKSRSMKGVEHV